MTLDIDVTVRGLPENRAMLDGIVARAGDFTPVFEAVAQDFGSEMTQEFAAQGAHGGDGWEPLSAFWRERKADLGLSPAILVATGRLRRSLTDAGGESSITASEHKLSMGTDVPYAHFVTLGTEKLPARIPQPAPEREEEWVEWLSAYLHEGKR